MKIIARSRVGGSHKADRSVGRAGATESVRKSSGRKCERRKLVRTYWELNGESIDRADQYHGDEGDRSDHPEVV